MSDSINYDELDKAVSAAINAKQAAKGEPKPAAKPVAVKPQPVAKRPASRGMFMDFAPVNNTRRIVVKKTIETHTIARVAANPATKATPTIARPRIAPVARPVQARPVAKPAPIRAAAQEFPARPTVKLAPRPAQPALRVAEKPTPKVTEAKPVLRPVEPAPNANNYSLGVRSHSSTLTPKSKNAHSAVIFQRRALPPFTARAMSIARNPLSKTPKPPKNTLSPKVVKRNPAGSGHLLFSPLSPPAVVSATSLI